MEIKLVPNISARSDIWRNFAFEADHKGVIVDKKHVVCTLCKTKIGYSGNTSNLSVHAAKCHKVLAQKHSSESMMRHFAIVPKLSATSKRAREITDSVVEMVVRDLRPMNIVEGAGFKEMVRHMIPEYTLIGRSTVSRRIALLAEEKREVLRNELKTYKFVCITLDFWTSLANESFLGITCHFVDSDWQLQSRVLEATPVPVSHTSVNVIANMNDMEARWELHGKVVAYVSDNAANMIKAIVDKPGGLVRCAAHTIQLSVGKGLKIPKLVELVVKIRRIVTHFHKSAVANKSLEALQDNADPDETNNNKLVQDVSTRWNSTHDMLQSVIANRGPVNAYLMDDANLDFLVITAVENVNMIDICQLLEPFKEATVYLGGQKYETASAVPVIFRNLIKETIPKPNDSNLIKLVKRAIGDDLRSRDLGDIIPKVSALSTRYRNLKFIVDDDAREALWEDLESEVQDVITSKGEAGDNGELVDDPHPAAKVRRLLDDSDDEDEINQIILPNNEAADEMRLYRGMPKSELSAFDWWKAHANELPNLAVIARKYLCVVATSVPCERLFSKAGLLVNDIRASLDGSTINDMLFLNNQLNNNVK